MGAHRYTLLDVFTATPLEGNALAVVHDADALDEPTMLACARETRLSETTFVQRAHVAGADYRNRIFTVERELPFAGHPSLGTAVAVARAEHGGGDDAPRELRYVQQTGAGLQPIDVRLLDARRAHASMLQEPLRHGAELPRAQVVAAIGLTPEHADRTLPPQLVGSGLTQLIVPLRDLDALARARPDWPAVERLLHVHGATVLYAAVCDPAAAHARTRAFVSAAVGEDPATGSAAGPLCGYLAARAGVGAIAIEQGIEMGRPSRIEAALAGERPRVGGDVVVVGDGTLHL
ncbi:MAG: PhzF family phenazine biosynthesis protein [Actinobacteria bacterium]|nr:PhzF family phenazine biosynthesis protein [Actinomycetota bacterium]